MTDMKLFDDDKCSPIILSMKTFMSNINSSKDIILGLIHQTYTYKKNDKILINIVTDEEVVENTRGASPAMKFVGTLEEEFADLIVINYVTYDWGNVTNIVEALIYIDKMNNNTCVGSLPPYSHDTRLIYCEDKILYPETMVDTLNVISTLDSDNCIWGATGFDILNMSITLRKEHGRLVEVIEGYGGVVVPIGSFVTDFLDYINFIRETDIILLLNSSDIVISNYFSKQKIPKKIARLDRRDYTFDSIWSRIKYDGCSSKNMHSRNEVWEAYVDAIYLLSGWKELYLQILC